MARILTVRAFSAPERYMAWRGNTDGSWEGESTKTLFGAVVLCVLWAISGHSSCVETYDKETV